MVLNIKRPGKFYFLKHSSFSRLRIGIVRTFKLASPKVVAYLATVRFSLSMVIRQAKWETTTHTASNWIKCILYNSQWVLTLSKARTLCPRFTPKRPSQSFVQDLDDTAGCATWLKTWILKKESPSSVFGYSSSAMWSDYSQSTWLYPPFLRF